MDSKLKENKILLNRLAYFFKHFRPDQKKEMAGPVREFLAESPEKAPRSKHLSKILDFMTQRVFKPIGRFGRVILLNRQSPQTLKKRREKMKPTFLLLHASSKNVQRRYCAYLTPKRRRTVKKRITQSNDR